MNEREQLAAIQAETQASLEESRRGLVWLEILRTPFDGRYLRDSIANQNLVFSWLHPGESLTPKFLAQIFKERPQAKNELTWSPPELTPQEKKQQRDTRRAVFEQACRHFKISTCEANWSLYAKTNSSSSIHPRNKSQTNRSWTGSPK